MKAEAVEVVENFWKLMATNDFCSVGSLPGDEFVLDWPQSNERIRGRDNFDRMNEEYPTQGCWEFIVNRIVGSEVEAVSDVSVTDGVQKARAVSFFTISNEKYSKDGRVLAGHLLGPAESQTPGREDRFLIWTYCKTTSTGAASCDS